MQNLTTTLYEDIVNKREVVLPAGEAKFNWIDVADIGEVAAKVLLKFEDFKDKAYDLTGLENLSFGQVIAQINENIESPIKYRRVNPVHFYLLKKKEGMPNGKIIVLLMLHFLPRFQSAPEISSFVELVTGRQPTTVKEFIFRHHGDFERQD